MRYVLIALGVLCALILIYIFLIFPSVRKKTDIFKKQPLYAHRGLFGGDLPENSMAAFAAAVEAGYGIELDVHTTTDGVAVVHHDDSLIRLCGVDKMIEQCSYDEIKDVTLPDGSRLPLFSEVLALVDGRVPLIVELKATKSADTRVADVAARELENYKGEYCIESFDPFVVKRYKKFRRGVMCGQLAGRTYEKSDSFSRKVTKFLAEKMVFNVISRPDFVAYQFAYRRNISCVLCRLFGAESAYWTIKNQNDCAVTRKAGAAAIFQEFRA